MMWRILFLFLRKVGVGYRPSYIGLYQRFTCFAHRALLLLSHTSIFTPLLLDSPALPTILVFIFFLMCSWKSELPAALYKPSPNAVYDIALFAIEIPRSIFATCVITDVLSSTDSMLRPPLKRHWTWGKPALKYNRQFQGLLNQHHPATLILMDSRWSTIHQRFRL